MSKNAAIYSCRIKQTRSRAHPRVYDLSEMTTTVNTLGITGCVCGSDAMIHEGTCYIVNRAQEPPLFCTHTEDANTYKVRYTWGAIYPSICGSVVSSMKNDEKKRQHERVH